MQLDLCCLASSDGCLHQLECSTKIYQFFIQTAVAEDFDAEFGILKTIRMALLPNTKFSGLGEGKLNKSFTLSCSATLAPAMHIHNCLKCSAYLQTNHRAVLSRSQNCWWGTNSGRHPKATQKCNKPNCAQHCQHRFCIPVFVQKSLEIPKGMGYSFYH